MDASKNLAGEQTLVYKGTTSKETGSRLFYVFQDSLHPTRQIIIPVKEDQTLEQVQESARQIQELNMRSDVEDGLVPPLPTRARR